MPTSNCSSAPHGFSFHCALYGTQYGVQLQPLPLALLLCSDEKVQTCTIDSHEEAGEPLEVQLPKYTTKVPAAGENVIYYFSTRLIE